MSGLTVDAGRKIPDGLLSIHFFALAQYMKS